MQRHKVMRLIFFICCVSTVSQNVQVWVNRLNVLVLNVYNCMLTQWWLLCLCVCSWTSVGHSHPEQVVKANCLHMWRIFKCLEWSWFQEAAEGLERFSVVYSMKQPAWAPTTPTPPPFFSLKPVPFFLPLVMLMGVKVRGHTGRSVWLDTDLHYQKWKTQ